MDMVKKSGGQHPVSFPCPTVMAEGLADDSISHWFLVDDGVPMPTRKENKPPYCVPSMKQIRAIRPNGYKVVSTFSGAGGSCTGYRMAGYTVVWANEFVPAAQESYKANADSILDGRDIKQVTAGDILKATKLKRGELDLFDGSPPCQAFSTAGKREKGWGKDKTYEHGAKQKNETLFDEYIRLVDGLQPKVFVAENVSGLVKGVAKGFFLEILAALKACGYNVKAKLLDAQWLGVPQMRQRIIFIGVRNDLGLEPAFPDPLPYRYSVRDALPWIVSHQQVTGGAWEYDARKDEPSYSVRSSGVGQLIVESNVNEAQMIIGNDAFESKWGSVNNPNPTVMAQGPNKQGGFIKQDTEKRKFTIAELKRICAFPDDFILTGSYAQQWERLGNSVPPVMMSYIAQAIRVEILDKVSNAKQAKARR